MTLAGLVAVAAIVVAACSSGGGASASARQPRPRQPASAAASAAASTGGLEVKAVQDPKLGAYLAGPDGKTLYVFTKDAAGKSVCNGDCAKNWPPLTVDANADRQRRRRRHRDVRDRQAR